MELLARIAETVPLPAEELIPLVMKVLPSLPGKRGSVLAARALNQALGRAMGTDRDKIVAVLLDRAGRTMDGADALRTGLSTSVPTELVSRNLILFDSAPPETRGAFLRVPEALAESIMARHSLDLSYQAAEAAARLLWDSSKANNRGYIRASATFLHFLMRQRGISASPIIAAAFPSVYRELQQDSIPDFLTIVFIFMDWDRCKIARRDLADALLSSQWRPKDIALAAARAGDPERILHNVARRPGGPSAIASIQKDLASIPDPWRVQVQKAINELGKRSSLSGKIPFDI